MSEIRKILDKARKKKRRPIRQRTAQTNVNIVIKNVVNKENTDKKDVHERPDVFPCPSA